MTDNVRGWLPATALFGPALDAAVLWLSDQWLADWCIDPEPLIAGASGDDAGSASAAPGNCVDIDPDAARNLGRAISGIAATAATSTADRHLLEQLGKRAADDLARRLTGNGSLAVSQQECSFHRVIVACERHGFRLDIRLNPESAIRLRRNHAAPVNAKPDIDKNAMAAALTAQSVKVAARVGACALSLEALRELGVGDTVLLQKPIAAPVDLVVDGQVVVASAGPLVIEDTTMMLVVGQPASAIGASQ
jgi:flagellar motor switch/type III secretory pathway protein FliN